MKQEEQTAGKTIYIIIMVFYGTHLKEVYFLEFVYIVRTWFN